MNIPANPKIYHITHQENIAHIASSGGLISDAKRIESKLGCRVVGMDEIKRRRLEKIEVSCHPRTKVGQYVPFYFCPRSIMLYLLYMGNHPGIEYLDGQESIVHLQADLHTTIQWANDNDVKWSFSDQNASGYLAEFFTSLEDLGKINWLAVAARDFRSPEVKEGKQAEFLVYGEFPWVLVEKIGVMTASAGQQLRTTLRQAAHQPPVHAKPQWYY